MFDCNLLKNGMCINLCIFCLELSCVNFVDIMCCTDIIDVKKKMKRQQVDITHPTELVTVANTVDCIC